eukprot:TRINITY_DN5119_c0_g2_i1.p3 TRINITY_DN5119_c0_g2~~TRINITY_DN5119_c0_g2_i1.p3  ORF type:complete len:195 (+),score=23.76 TRINITY_DN5119_c0_g2_i1:63-587(+)
MASSVSVQKNEWGMEYSIHECPKVVTQELKHIFPSLDTDGVMVVPTCQRSNVDLANWGEDADKEKDILLQKFMDWAKVVAEELSKKGYWCDYVDPCSGLSVINKETQNVYSEVEGLQVLMGYSAANAGCCKIILHPQWGAAVYPATLFAKAPKEDLQAAIAEADTSLGKGRFVQ